MRLKASQRRTLKHQRGSSPGGTRQTNKPLKVRDLPDTHSGFFASVLVFYCKVCEQERPVEEFEFIGSSNRRHGTNRHSLCRTCRESITVVKCAKCERDLPRDAFSESTGRVCGLMSYCRDCQRESTKKSVENAKRIRQELSDAHRVRAAGEQPGRCLAFINVGSFTRIGIRCSRDASAGGYCLTHASAQERRIGGALRRIRAGTEQFGSRRWREEYERRQQAELLTLNDELSVLVAEQAKDARINQIGKPWVVALDKRLGDSGESSLLDFVDHGGRLAFGQRSTPDFSDAVCAVIDHRRQIDQWAMEITA